MSLSPLDAQGLRTLTALEFRRIQELVHESSGIALADTKQALVVMRLSRRLRELHLESFSDYLAHVRADKSGMELVQLLDRITTNETYFFREPGHFEYLVQHAVPSWLHAMDAGLMAPAVRAWSAGCSTGEEPYSLAMVLTAHLPADVAIHIHATDLSMHVLERTREAVWPIRRAKEIPPPFLKAYMLRGTGSQAGNMKACPELRDLVQVQRLNLNDTSYPVGTYDVIFCRNVLIYFDAATRRRVVDQLIDHLGPHSYFFVGHAETLMGVTQRVRTLAPTVYRLVGDTSCERQAVPSHLRTRQR